MAVAATEMISTVIWSNPIFDAEEPDGVGVEERWEGGVGVAVPDLPQADHEDQDPDGGDHLQGGRGVLERAGDQLQDQTLERREHEEAEGRRIGPGHAVLGVQPVEDEHR